METIASRSGKITSFDGTQLYYVKDIPKDRRAVVVIVHGFCEHLGRYEYVKDKFVEYGYGVYRFDNRGHGKSEGRRGDIEDFDHFIQDTHVIVKLASDENMDIPVFMLGHSMGGFIAAAYGIKYKDRIRGQILSGAATAKLPQVNGTMGKILKAGNILLPKVKLKNSLSKLLSRDEQVVGDYEKDPLNLKSATVRLHYEFLIRGIEWLNENIDQYHYPCLIVHGGDDKIIDKEASVNFYNRISSQDKELKIYEGLYHECMNEQERDMVIEDIHQWIEKRI